MTTETLNAILNRIPPKQHKQATERIRAAEMCGWSDITLFVDGETPADQADLVGIKANGDFDFLP